MTEAGTQSAKRAYGSVNLRATDCEKKRRIQCEKALAFGHTAEDAYPSRSSKQHFSIKFPDIHSTKK